MKQMTRGGFRILTPEERAARERRVQRKKVHYSPSLLATFARCGHRRVENTTSDPAQVTCGTCWRLMDAREREGMKETREG